MRQYVSHPSFTASGQRVGRPPGVKDSHPRAKVKRTRSIQRALKGFAPPAGKGDIAAVAAAISVPGVSEDEIASRLQTFLRKHRVPADAPPELAQLAGLALARMVMVLLGRIGFRQAPSALKAAVALRDELVGPLPSSVNLNGTISLSALVLAAQKRAMEQKAAGEAQGRLPAPAPPAAARLHGSQPHPATDNQQSAADRSADEED